MIGTEIIIDETKMKILLQKAFELGFLTNSACPEIDYKKEAWIIACKLFDDRKEAV